MLTNCLDALEDFCTSDVKVFKGLIIYLNSIFAFQNRLQTCFVTIWTLCVPNNVYPKKFLYHLLNVYFIYKLNEIVYEYFRKKNVFKRNKYVSTRALNIEIYGLVHTSSSSSSTVIHLEYNNYKKTSGCDNSFVIIVDFA